MLEGFSESIPTCYSEPPWELVDNKMKVDLPSKLREDKPAEVLRHEFIEMLNDQEYTKIYTNGLVDQQKSGAGYYTQIGKSYFVPFSSISSLDAELLVINADLMHCLQIEAEMSRCV